ncbi:FAD/NAD(P)-binding domain-containing protein [Cadophora sp. DSE1049]|nr:FAD/NAD(P)-binding domain-containing protein [Cadophora sp. DSE1049]
MAEQNRVRSVAIIGAGAAGAITAAAFAAEKYFDRIQVFERRETAGGTWIYDPSPPGSLPLRPGGLPPDVDPPLSIPDELPKITSPNRQERWHKTPIYSSLTTNVPSIAMSFSDLPFAYGPFVPHNIPKQYVESYFSHHKTDSLLSLNTTVEDLSVIEESAKGSERWKLTLRKHDSVRGVDIWWQAEFDAVVLANGHYGVPFIPEVKGLAEYLELFPGRVVHSKIYRTPQLYRNKRVLTIGNSASSHDLTNDLLLEASLPVYQSRRSASRWDGDEPPPGIAWKPIIKEFLPSGRILFEDDTYLDDIDTVIYCTGYKASFPFWNVKNNGREIWDYEKNKLVKSYIHTFFHDFKTLGIVGIPRVLTFRSFEYQAIALARLFSGRQAKDLPGLEEQAKWEKGREERVKRDGKKFHDIEWETGETLGWLGQLYGIAGLALLTGEGRVPPVLGEEVRWAIEHLRKYPEPGKDSEKGSEETGKHEGDDRLGAESDWVLVERKKKDLLAFI